MQYLFSTPTLLLMKYPMSSMTAAMAVVMIAVAFMFKTPSTISNDIFFSPF